MLSYTLALLCRLLSFLFSFPQPSPSELYTLSLHDALPISHVGALAAHVGPGDDEHAAFGVEHEIVRLERLMLNPERRMLRSEEHTSELQSLRHLVCRLLLEKKKKNNTNLKTHTKHTRLDHH